MGKWGNYMTLNNKHPLYGNRLYVINIIEKKICIGYFLYIISPFSHRPEERFGFPLPSPEEVGALPFPSEVIYLDMAVFMSTMFIDSKCLFLRFPQFFTSFRSKSLSRKKLGEFPSFFHISFYLLLPHYETETSELSKGAND